VADLVVMVNGLPGAGKTTLATRLGAALRVPVVSKDAVKDALAAAVPAAPPRTLGATAIEAAWSLVAGIAGTVVLESWWFRPRDLGFAEAAVRRCGNPAVVEVWCDVPAEVAMQRYADRSRPAFYEDARRLADSWPDWARRAEPLGLGRVVRVDTTAEVDVDALAQRLAA
jgi:predicted kinase